MDKQKLDFSNITIVEPEQFDPCEYVVGEIINAFEQPQDIVMQRRHWWYLQWMVVKYGRDETRAWIKQCDLARGNVPFGDALHAWIYKEDQLRQKEGKPRPPRADEIYAPLAPDEPQD